MLARAVRLWADVLKMEAKDACGGGEELLSLWALAKAWMSPTIHKGTCILEKLAVLSVLYGCSRISTDG